MSLEEKAKATAKNVEGKIQDAVGKATGDVGDQAEGKAKQVEASATHAKEDIKDDVKNVADKL
ncbi:MAG TPA: CsbD family protein [Thermosynechococcaceae cyanobacterium]